MVGAPSFSQPILWIQQTLQSLPRNSSSSSVNFHFPISPLLVRKIILTISTNTPFLYNSNEYNSLFTYFFLRKTIATIYTKNIFRTSNILPIQAASKHQEVREYCEDWHCLISPFFLKVWTVIAGLTQNHWFFTAQTQKIDTLQVWQTIQPTFSNTPYFHYFQIQLIPLQELTFPWKPVA